MNYIIHSVWFYIISIVDALKGLSVVVAILSILIACSLLYDSLTETEENKKKRFRVAKKLFIVCIVFTLLSIFIPNKNTLMQIMIAKYATYDNASATIQTVQNAADYIIESVGKLNGG